MYAFIWILKILCHIATLINTVSVPWKISQHFPITIVFHENLSTTPFMRSYYTVVCGMQQSCILLYMVLLGTEHYFSTWNQLYRTFKVSDLARCWNGPCKIQHVQMKFLWSHILHVSHWVQKTFSRFNCFHFNGITIYMEQHMYK